MKIGKEQITIVPPDGGWGWFIVLGSILINFSTKAIGSTFGLLFGDFLLHKGVQTTGATLVLSTMDGICNFTGLIVGPLIRKYSYRKVAIVGALMSSSAILLTVPANCMLHITITFGVIGGAGFGLVGSCALVGLNDYFSKLKGQAVGLSMTGTSMGYMLMPQIISFLLDEYDFRSVLLILSALSLHSVVGASLFQPVCWHKKAALAEHEAVHVLVPCDKIERSASIITTYGVRFNNSRHNLFATSSNAFLRKKSVISNISLLDDAEYAFHMQGIAGKNSDTALEKHPKTAIRNSIKEYLSRFCKVFELDLLKDKVYLNILYGLSICIVAEMNFKLILPFFLLNLGFTRSDIAFAISSMAAADLCSRIIIPPIVDRITYSWRATFLFGLTCLALAQFCFSLQTTIGPLICTIMVIGFFRGMTLLSFPLVLVEYSSGNNFPSVLGLSMVCRGIFVAIFGPISGYIRDVTNSYRLFIYFQHLLITSVLVSWMIEKLISKCTNNNSQTIVEEYHKEAEDNYSLTIS